MTLEEKFRALKTSGIFHHIIEKNAYSFYADCPLCNTGNKKFSVIISDKSNSIVMNCAKCQSRDDAKRNDYLTALGLTTKDLHADEEPKPKATVIKDKVRTHTYHNIDGSYFGDKVIEPRTDGEKNVRWQKKGKKAKTGECSNAPLFDIHKIAQAVSDTTIYFAEGEKDAETLQSFGYIATSLANGGGAKQWQNLFDTILSGHPIVILGDNDDIGRKCTTYIASKVLNISPSVKIVNAVDILPSVKQKGDITDICDELGKDKTIELLQQAIERTPNYTQADADANGDNLPPYYATAKDGYKINASLLADHFLKTVKLIKVAESTSSKPHFYLYENGVYKPISELKIKQILSELIISPSPNFDGNKWYSAKTVEDAYKKILYVGSITSPIKLNDCETIINFKNGYLHIDLTSGDMHFTHGHNSSTLCTIQLPIEYKENYSVDIEKDAPTFYKFISNLVSPEDLIPLCQFLGFSLSNIKPERMKKALFLKGETNCGKSVLFNLMVYLIGYSNCFSYSLSSESQFDNYKWFGKRFGGESESNSNTIKNITALKQLTGGDLVSVEQKFHDSFSAKFTGVLMFNYNELPTFYGDKGNETYNKMLLIECNSAVPESQRDPFLLDKLKSESQAIVLWLLEILQVFIANNYIFSVSEHSKQLMNQYKEDNSSIISFFCERCTTELAEGSKGIELSEFRHAYNDYCKENYLQPLPNNKIDYQLSQYLDYVQIEQSKYFQTHTTTPTKQFLKRRIKNNGKLITYYNFSWII